MRRHPGHYAAACAFTLFGIAFGCGPAKHAESESDCNGKDYGTCSTCASEDRCGWCNGQCHFSTNKDKAAPDVCGDAKWIWSTNDCKESEFPPPPPPSGAASTGG